jgi:hypothetical protein
MHDSPRNFVILTPYIATALVFICFAVAALFEALRTPEGDEAGSGLPKEAEAELLL